MNKQFILQLKEQANQFFTRLKQKNKYERLLNDYRELAEQRPNDMRIRVKMAETYFKAHETQKAVEIFQEVAHHFESQKFTLKAVAMYRNILKLKPGLVDINLKLAELFKQMDMLPEAACEYRIAIELLGAKGEKEKQLEICERLIEVDPSPISRRRYGEILQTYGMKEEAVKQFDLIAQYYRKQKEYDKLLRIFELILPHRPSDVNLVKDMAILYLRRQEPDFALRLIERSKLEGEGAFAELYQKAQLMKKALLRAPKATGLSTKTA